jgi:hypothetical protein
VKTEQQSLRLIGYWLNPLTESEKHFPDPRKLVLSGWIDPESKILLLRYLRNAPVYETYRGLSWCRFKCGIENREMGCRELSDGDWVWPEGLAHYVERHEVMLPEEFVRSVLFRTIPPILQPRKQMEVDLNYWLTWAKNVV